MEIKGRKQYQANVFMATFLNVFFLPSCNLMSLWLKHKRNIRPYYIKAPSFLKLVFFFLVLQNGPRHLPR